jgi:hypothetical protein
MDNSHAEVVADYLKGKPILNSQAFWLKNGNEGLIQLEYLMIDKHITEEQYNEVRLSASKYYILRKNHESYRKLDGE